MNWHKTDPVRLRRPPALGRYRYVRWRWHLLFGAIDLVGGALWAALRRRLHRRSENHPPPRSILLVQLDHLGDAVISAAVIPAIRARYPRARLEVLASTWNREVFETLPDIDRVHVSRINRFARSWQPHWPLAMVWWGLRLRRERYDLAVDLRGEFPLALILWLAGAKRRIGWNCGGGGFLLTDSATFVPGRPEIESRLALVSLFDVGPTRALTRRDAWFRPPRAAVARIERRMSGSGGQPLVVLHVGAGTPAKRWPAAHWRELMGRLIVEIGPRIVLVGGRDDQSFAAEIRERKEWPDVGDWTGQLSVTETAALIQRASLFIGGDSGPAHLAAAVGTPAVVLFSGTNRVRQWRPRGTVTIVRHQVACSPCHLKHCPLADHPCMSRISAEQVMCSVRRALAKGAGRRAQGTGSPKSKAGVGHSGLGVGASGATRKSQSPASPLRVKVKRNEVGTDMIAPLQTRPKRKPSHRLMAARAMIAAMFLSSESAPAPRIATWKAWLFTAWLVIVLLCYSLSMAGYPF